MRGVKIFSFVLAMLFVWLHIFSIATPALAGPIGISPSEIHLTITPDQQVDEVFVFQRPSPLLTDIVDITIRGEGSEKMIMEAGERGILPAGEQYVSFPFSVPANSLTSGTTYEWTVGFIKQEAEEMSSGNLIKLGVTGKIVIQVVDELPPEMFPIDLSIKDASAVALSLSDLDIVFNEQTHLFSGVSWSIQNNSEDYIKHIPFVYTISKGGEILSRTNGSVPNTLAPNELFTQTNGGGITKSGRYNFSVTVGDQTLQVSKILFFWQIHELSFSATYFFVGQILLLLLLILLFRLTHRVAFVVPALCLLIFLSVVLFYMAIQPMNLVVDEDALSNQVGFLLVGIPDQGNAFIRLSDGKQQKFDGQWRFSATERSQIYAFPVALAEKYGYLVSVQGSTPFDLSVLPGQVQSVEENSTGTFAMFSGTNDEEEKTFFCVTEIKLVNGPDCFPLEEVVKEEIVDITFSEQVPQVIFLRTKDATFEYDLWLRQLSEAQVDHAKFDHSQIAMESFYQTKPLTSLFGITIFQNKLYFVPRGLEAYPLSETVVIFQETDDTKKRLYLGDLGTGEYKVLSDIPLDGSVYEFQKGSFIISP